MDQPRTETVAYVAYKANVEEKTSDRAPDKAEGQLRLLEALLFAAPTPLTVEAIAKHFARGPLGEGADIPALLERLREDYATRGMELVDSGGQWSLRTAPDLALYLRHETVKPVKLSRAVSETLAIIAYHQPVTRAEVEVIRGVATSRGVLDYLLQLGWVRPGRRRETPGRPLTWVTTPAFLDHFGLGSTTDLPGMEDLRAAGLLEAQQSATYGVVVSPMADDDEADLPPSAEGEPDELPDFVPEPMDVALSLPLPHEGTEETVA